MKYEKPEMEIIEFNANVYMTQSGGEGTETNGPSVDTGDGWG